jgi:HAD superfamily hydrolase (TIGR01490 family)
MEAAFFDLDKTVIAKSSVLAFGKPFYREGLLPKSALLKSLYSQTLYRLGGADEAKMDKARESMLTLTRGWEQARVRDVVMDTFEKIVSPIIYAEALELFHSHREAGRKVFLVSSSPVEIVEALGDYLGVDEVIATRGRIDETGHYTGELDFYAYGAHKAQAIRELAAREYINLPMSYAYSDSITDLPMLDVVGHPVAVNADKELARIARERDWEMRDFERPVRLRDRMPVPPAGPTIAVGGALAAAGAGVAVWWWLRRRNDAA